MDLYRVETIARHCMGHLNVRFVWYHGELNTGSGYRHDDMFAGMAVEMSQRKALAEL